MTVTNIHKDLDALTMTVSASFTAPIERVWKLWDDPRQLERWWGPPSWPATVVDHDLTPGGAVSYFMTGPEGQKSRGWWRVLAVEPPRSLEVEDGFADDDGRPNESMPTTTMHVELHPSSAGTDVVITSRFPSREALEQMLNMGMEEGLREAMGQMDALLVA